MRFAPFCLFGAKKTCDSHISETYIHSTKMYTQDQRQDNSDLPLYAGMISNDDQDDNDTSNDAQLALDMQLAINLQEAAEQSEARESSSATRTATDNGYSNGALSSSDGESMLFVCCELEGRLVEMLVDSGAGRSVISYKMVQKLGLGNHLNTRVRGTARGIGSATIKGILENVACQIGHVEFRLFFLVLETNDPWLILGLDQMRRFKCMIDLDANLLVFGGKDGVSVPFLSPELAASAVARTMEHYHTNNVNHQPKGRNLFNNIFGGSK